jgi:hypothetical protein
MILPDDRSHLRSGVRAPGGSSVEVNSGDVASHWSFGLRVAGVMIAVILFVGLLRRRRSLDRAGRLRVVLIVVTGWW